MKYAFFYTMKNWDQPVLWTCSVCDPFAHAPLKELGGGNVWMPQKYTSSQQFLYLLLSQIPFPGWPFVCCLVMMYKISLLNCFLHTTLPIPHSKYCFFLHLSIFSIVVVFYLVFVFVVEPNTFSRLTIRWLSHLFPRWRSTILSSHNKRAANKVGVSL